MTIPLDRELAILFLSGRIATEDRPWVDTGAGHATERAKSLADMFARARRYEMKRAIEAIEPASTVSSEVQSILRAAQAMIRRIDEVQSAARP
jgi:hypothetical protein